MPEGLVIGNRRELVDPSDYRFIHPHFGMSGRQTHRTSLNDEGLSVERVSLCRYRLFCVCAGPSSSC